MPVKDVLDLCQRDAVARELRFVLIIKEERINVNHQKLPGPTCLTASVQDVSYAMYSMVYNGEASMRQEFLMLAEGAEAVNGKIYILGGGVDHHNGASFPTALKVDMALGVLVGWGETNQTIDLKVRVVDEDEVEAFMVGAEMRVGRPPQANPGQDIRSLIAIRGPFPLAKPGAYKAVMLLNEVPQEPPFRFWVQQVPMPAISS